MLHSSRPRSVHDLRKALEGKKGVGSVGNPNPLRFVIQLLNFESQVSNVLAGPSEQTSVFETRYQKNVNTQLSEIRPPVPGWLHAKL